MLDHWLRSNHFPFGKRLKVFRGHAFENSCVVVAFLGWLAEIVYQFEELISCGLKLLFAFIWNAQHNKVTIFHFSLYVLIVYTVDFNFPVEPFEFFPVGLVRQVKWNPEFNQFLFIVMVLVQPRFHCSGRPVLEIGRQEAVSIPVEGKEGKQQYGSKFFHASNTDLKNMDFAAHTLLL